MRSKPFGNAIAHSLAQPFAARKRQRRPERRHLGLETLEPRTMLADTSAWLNGGAYLRTDRSSTPVPTVNGGYTIEAWVNRVDTNRCEAVVTSGYNVILLSQGFWFGLCRGGRPYFHSNTGFGSAHVGATQVPANVWTHIAATWSPFEERIYVNGELDSVRTPGTEPQRGKTYLYVGAQYQENTLFSPGPADRFWGNISEARVWDTVRTQDQIRRGADVLDAHSAGANAPAVTLDSPIGPVDPSAEFVTVAWSASDLDGDAISIMVAL